MAHYTTQFTSKPYGKYDPDESLKVWANGGSVLLEVKVSASQWITHKTYTSDAAEMVEVAGATIRITPNGGAEFNFGDGV